MGRNSCKIRVIHHQQRSSSNFSKSILKFNQLLKFVNFNVIYIFKAQNISTSIKNYFLNLLFTCIDNRCMYVL